MSAKRIGFVFGVFAMGVILIAGGAASADQPIVLKAGGISPPTADVSIAAEFFCKRVGELTNGKVKVDFYPANQLGNAPAQLENVTAGAQDIFCSSFAWVGSLIKDYAILQLPYVFRDADHLVKFMESPMTQGYRDDLGSKFQMKIIAYNWFRLPRVIFAKKPIFKIEDMKGLKFRMPFLPMYKKYVPAWGAIPVTVAWGEYYLALKQGLVDMGESCAENIYNMKFYEAAPYITMLDFNYDNQMIMININRFNKLSPEFQKALIQSGQEAGDFFTQRVRKQFEIDKKKMMDEGAVFIYTSTKSWEETIPALAEDCEKDKFWTPGLYEKVRAIK